LKKSYAVKARYAGGGGRLGQVFLGNKEGWGKKNPKIRE